jgi:integrase
MAWRETYKTKKGLRYIVRWRKGGKKQARIAGPLVSTANKLVVAVEDDLVQPQPITSLPTVREAFRQYLKLLESTVRTRTREIARTSLEPFVDQYGPRHLSTIKPSELEQFKNGLLDKRASNGINIIVRNLKTFLNFCVRSGFIEVSPARSLKQFQVKPVARFLNREEMLKLYLASSKKMRRAIFVLYRTGMRRGEFLNIKPEHLGFSDILVSGKTGERRIPLTPKVKRIVQAILKDQFTSPAFDIGFQMASKRAQIGRIRAHDLRHTWASLYLKGGGDLASLRLLGGWRNLATLQIYAHFQDSHLAERMARIKL